MTLALRRRSLPAVALSVLGVALSLLTASCALDDSGAVNTSRSGALPSDTTAPTSPAGTPLTGAGTGSSMGSNGLGGGRGSF